jgi:hypothetical protein
MASLSLQGMGEALVWQGATDAPSFEAYIQQVLAPSLQRGQIVVMDNLSSLKARAGATGHRGSWLSTPVSAHLLTRLLAH